MRFYTYILFHTYQSINKKVALKKLKVIDKALKTKNIHNYYTTQYESHIITPYNY